MIFVDSNIPMYVVGGEHPHKLDAQRVLERLIVQRRRLVTSSEVFQEILRHYVYTDRRNLIEIAFETLRGVVDDVLAVEEADVFAAKNLVHGHRELSSRDAVHTAVMRRHGISEVLSFDQGFDALTDIKRLPVS